MERQEKKLIKTYRNTLLMSRDYLSKKIGVSKSTIERWERGESNPSTENLIRLGEVFGCGVDGIFLPTTSVKRENECCDCYEGHI